MSVRSGTVWLGALSCVVSFATPARAEPVRLRFTAPTGCPDETAFIAQITARTPRVEQARGEEAARTFRVEIVPAGDAFRGNLVIRELDGREAVRDVPPAPCDEVVAALALITAVAIDPDASQSPAPVAPASPPSPPPPSLPPARPPERSSPAPAKSSPPKSASASTSGDRFAIGANAAVATAVAPQPAPVFEGFVELRVDAPRLLSPSFRAAFLYAASGATVNAIGSARFRWYAGRIEACPLRWPAPRPARGDVDGSVAACAAVDVGALIGIGEGAVASSTQTRAWFAPGLLARGELEIVGHAFVELQAGATVPLPSYHFFFGPNDVTLFDVPRLGAITGGGVGVRWP